MVRMTVKKRPMYYNGRQIKPGETFEASDVDARYFARRDKAEEVPAAPPKTQRAPAPVVVEEPTKAVEVVPPTEAIRYGRRDMRADD